MKNLEIYCVTNKSIKFLEKTGYKLAAVGKEKFSKKYIKCNKKKNIYYKEKYYSELTFHYWFWKNLLEKKNNNLWIGFCQKRRFWLQSKNSSNNLLSKVPSNWKNYNAVICKKINLGKPKLSKLFKRGWKNIIQKPNILYSDRNYNIELHFDLFHGFRNLQKAAELVKKEDRDEFIEYIKKNRSFNPHIMCVAKPKILKLWFEDLFPWLKRCEAIFGFKELKGYDTTRLYAYLAERYHSFWFQKYSNYVEWPYKFIDTEKIKNLKN